jgi:hypothetical protein
MDRRILVCYCHRDLVVSRLMVHALAVYIVSSAVVVLCGMYELLTGLHAGNDRVAGVVHDQYYWHSLVHCVQASYLMYFDWWMWALFRLMIERER